MKTPCIVAKAGWLLICCMMFLPYHATTQISKQRTFTGQALHEIAFPIGGIGTGCISLGGRGELRDWEIFNRPAKGSHLDFSFFALWAQRAGKPAVARVLERRFLPPYHDDGFGLPQRQLSGLPRLAEAVFQGAYPFADVDFKDDDLPVQVHLEAWNPFIPLDVDNSAIPVALFDWTLTNPSNDTVMVSLAACISNPIGDRYTDVNGKKPGLGLNVNEYLDEGTFQGIRLSSWKVPEEDPNYGTMALVTTHRAVDVQTRWYHGGWWDPCHIFWDDFSDNGRLKEVRDATVSDSTSSDVSSLVLRAKIPPRKKVNLPVMVTWHFPNRENYWNRESAVRGKMMRNYVARYFKDAWEVARYVVENRSRLEQETRAFSDALFSSSLPAYVLDAVSSQMSTLKSTVCILLEDGSFFGFEGVGNEAGCCPLNCTHVWNYEQALAYLFPQLERSMRETDFLHNTLPNGYMTFRTLIPLGEAQWRFKPCADGQMGEIVRAYREWQLSGDSVWLRTLWPSIKRALGFAWKGVGDPPPAGYEWMKEQIVMPWDPDRDGVMDAEQHNTYDIEFYGPNTMTGSLYLAALKAGAVMADAMGDPTSAGEYRELFERGRRRYDEITWNGEYFRQEVAVRPGLKVPANLVTPTGSQCDSGCACRPANKRRALEAGETTPKYQYGTGCLADQLLGQYLAYVTGLGYVLDSAHVAQAMRSIFRNNFRKSLTSWANVQRVYALNEEAGLVLCTWPHGDRPALPFPYSDEVWTGIEYQVAASLIYAGFVDEGLKVVKAVRDRYNGLHRNPWDEEECGHHYARAMSSWALLLALSGFHYDGVKGEMVFAPARPGKNFRCFWSCGTGWGTVKMEERKGRHSVAIRPIHGRVSVATLVVPGTHLRGGGAVVSVNGTPVKDVRTVVEGSHMKVHLGIPLDLGKGSVLNVLY
jgi:non-lysosomal glucosylceramidase